jgi:hypothetical protein
MDADKLTSSNNFAQSDRDQARASYAADYDMARARRAADELRKVEENDALNRIQPGKAKKTQSGWWDEEEAQAASR